MPVSRYRAWETKTRLCVAPCSYTQKHLTAQIVPEIRQMQQETTTMHRRFLKACAATTMWWHYATWSKVTITVTTQRWSTLVDPGMFPFFHNHTYITYIISATDIMNCSHVGHTFLSFLMITKRNKCTQIHLYRRRTSGEVGLPPSHAPDTGDCLCLSENLFETRHYYEQKLCKYCTDRDEKYLYKA